MPAALETRKVELRDSDMLFVDYRVIVIVTTKSRHNTSWESCAAWRMDVLLTEARAVHPPAAQLPRGHGGHHCYGIRKRITLNLRLSVRADRRRQI